MGTGFDFGFDVGFADGAVEVFAFFGGVPALGAAAFCEY